MKKIAGLLLSIVLTMGLFINVSAHQVNNTEAGISFTLSDNWNLIQNEGMNYLYQNKYSSDEGITIEIAKGAYGYDIGLVDQSILDDICEEHFSDSNLSNALTAQNDAYVTVKTDSVVTGYETHNGTLYYRYEKAYTATAYGYRPTPFYDTAYITIRNGSLYTFVYERNYEANHFSDMTALLDSCSYDNGEIKIMVNGSRVFPDSAPIIFEDRTLVPIRVVAEAMGYDVSWNGQKRMVTMISKDGDTTLNFTIDDSEYVKNSSKNPLDVPAMIMNDRTYLPLRAVAEAMDADVNWDGTSRTVTITK